MDRGRAFEHGRSAQRAVRLFQEGVGVTAHDDLALALGFPFLVELEGDVDGDVASLVKERLCVPLRRPLPWPRNAAVRAARVVAFGWDVFPKTLSPEALEAVARDDDLADGEARELVATFLEYPSASWSAVYELVFLLEALAGGEAVIAALAERIEADPTEWLVVDGNRRLAIAALGMVFDRLPKKRADAVRPRLEALLALSRAPGVPLRALDLVLHGADGYERSAETTAWGRSLSDAFWLDRDAYARLAKLLRAPLPHMLPTAQWVVQGGPDALAGAADPSGWDFKGSRAEAQRYVAPQLRRLRAPAAAELLAALTDT